jgi:hypothetical protein
MRAIASVLFVVIAFQSAARAQPGPDTSPPRPAAPSAQPGQPYPAQPGQPYPPPGQPYPPPGIAVPPPYQYQPIPLTSVEQDLLNSGEIADNRHVGGIVVSLFFGLGIGQAVQGRYGDTGWIFTLGETASVVALFVGVVKTIDDCFDTRDEPGCNDHSTGNALLIGGLVGLAAFRIWEVVDAITGPPRHNARVRELRLRLGMPPTSFARRLKPYLAPPLSHDGGATAGLSLRF